MLRFALGIGLESMAMCPLPDRAVPIGACHPVLQIPDDGEGRAIREDRRTARNKGLLWFPMPDLALDGDPLEVRQCFDAALSFYRLFDQVHRRQHFRPCRLWHGSTQN